MATDPLGNRDRFTLDPEFVRAEVGRFLAEDGATEDATTLRVVPRDTRACGAIVAREACVVAGLDIACVVFQQLDSSLVIHKLADDGDSVAQGTRLMTLEGRAAPILSGERLALNLLQRLSGIATVTRRYVDALEGTGVSVSDTRKTTPGLRLFEKYAVRTGGGRNHRINLADAILIKDNHIAAAGGHLEALARTVKAGTRNPNGQRSLADLYLSKEQRARAYGPLPPVQIEVESLDQLKEVLDAGATSVLLDNMTPALTAQAVKLVRSHPKGGDCWIESSGGITLANIRQYADAGVDTISVGALTHSAPSVDIALDIDART